MSVDTIRDFFSFFLSAEHESVLSSDTDIMPRSPSQTQFNEIIEIFFANAHEVQRAKPAIKAQLSQLPAIRNIQSHSI